MVNLINNNYVEGIEIVGDNKKRVMCGWVDKVSYDSDGFACVDIQCDDEWMGDRGNTLFERYGEIKILPPKPRPQRSVKNRELTYQTWN